MIIKYVEERRCDVNEPDLSLTLGTNYICLGISFRSDRNPTMFTVCRDSDGEPVQFEAKLFTLVDESIPNDWVIEAQNKEYYGHGSFCLSPKEFAGDFWSNYHDGDEKAEQIFLDVVKRLA